MPEADDLDLLIRAARSAGDVATQFAGQSAQRWDKPGGAGPVTEADLAANDTIHDILRPARPGYGWLSEETEDDPARLSAPRTFIIDPIDGTRSFIEGSRTWAHALAVAEAGRITAAVIYLPLRGLMYTAARAAGAQLNGAPIRASAQRDLSGARLLAARPTLAPGNWPRGVPNVDRHYRPSLAYRMAVVAEGRFDALLTLRDTWEWDIAAGALIAEEAGAYVSDAAGDTLRFNSATAKTAGILAAPAELHTRLIDHRRPDAATS